MKSVRTILYFLFFLSLFSGCKNDAFPVLDSVDDSLQLRHNTQIRGEAFNNNVEDVDLAHPWNSYPGVQTAEEEETVIGEVLSNPYSLQIMNQAAMAVCAEQDIAFTPIRENALYVRFLPRSKDEYDYLMNESGLELFDYPLHRKIIKLGSYYRDPALPEQEVYTWLYTTVMEHQVQKYQTLLSKYPNLRKEIIELCYIPEEVEDTITPTPKKQTAKGNNEVEYNDLLEQKALEIAGMKPSQTSFTPTPAFWWIKKYKPKGRITVHDKYFNKTVPVKGVKVRVNLVVKWSSTYTDDNGYYEIPSYFRFGPFYAVIFENKHDFSIYKGINLAIVARYLAGFHSKKGHDIHFGGSALYWRDATINNVAHEYYKICMRDGIPSPPSNLKIWQWSAFCSSSAPMLPRIHHLIGHNGNNLLRDFARNFLYGAPLNILLNLLRSITPDVIIGNNSLVNTVFHELSHASHFRIVGSIIWAKYISYMITYPNYGYPDAKNSGICAVGEIWACAMGDIMEKELKNRPGVLRYSGSSYWFYPRPFTELLIDNTLSKHQLFSTVTMSSSREDLRRNLCQMYPNKAYRINEIFNKYPIPN